MDKEEIPMPNVTDFLAPACGLYCGICSDKINGECHGCGCECGCAGIWHFEHCNIAKCVNSRDLESCADCEELPCTLLIQFTNDPIWTTHSVCIENLRRRKEIGTKKWIEEQQEYWSNEHHCKKEIWQHDECSKKYRKWRENS